jgi:hypothetical protein
MKSSIFTRIAILALLASPILAQEAQKTAAPAGGSVELIAPDALDVARELGMNIAKFKAVYPEPVYATLSLTVFPVGAKEGQKLEQTTSNPLKEHVFSFTMKDTDIMAQALGMTPKPENAKTMQFSIFHPFASYTHQSKLPFGNLVPGQSLLTFVERQSLEPQELDKPIPLLIKAGPFDEKTPAPKSIRENYLNAPGYFLMEVTFSKTKPAEAKAEEKK